MNRLYSRSSFFGGVDRHCQQCGRYMVLGLDDRREDARYCSPRCRQRAYVARKRARSARSAALAPRRRQRLQRRFPAHSTHAAELDAQQIKTRPG